ncbi:DUF4946 domain-containing protein [Pseudomonas weihenstephanensis]|uniref:DUF4946 domain-containing protein n=1 Tax=Pseudomonas weihenstephanensis TaxID=1608994 RepID=UPI000652C939|nr:DUF4946 domain-containing protein [Pseudomonas weihenstephanensis]KMN17789.1 hypothetical protein TU87_14645 [Pseudomonas weihenstephanensis]
MTVLQRCSALIGLLCTFGLTPAWADSTQITWPRGWEVQAVPPAPDDNGQRQRAVKNDANGDPLMVMELTQTTLAPEHQVNMDAVLLQMRKTLQQNFAKGGYQSVCNKIHASTLGGLDALETTCKITQNGNHLMTQTLVAATRGSHAYALSYAGPADGYKAVKPEVQGIRASLRFAP